MRILMCNSFYYLRGGAERYFFNLSDLLRAHGHDVIPFSMKHVRNLPSEYSDYFVSSIDFPSLLKQKHGLASKLQVAERVIYSREAKRQIERLIRDTRPDIAHIHGIAHETSPSILDSIKGAGIPIVQTLHDYKLLCPNTSFISKGAVCERCKGHRYFSAALRRCKRDSLASSALASAELYIHKLLQIYERNVDVFVAPSRFLQQKMLEYGIQNQVQFLPNFIDIDEFVPCYEPAQHIVYAGRLVELKGVRTLLQALRELPSAHLYIIGEGELEPALREQARQYGLEHVTFTGHLSTAELVALVQRAACMVFPSEWYENCPMTVLEAFACATPVIGARIGGTTELIDDWRTGLLFEPGNHQELATKIRFMLDHPDQAIAMGRNARRQVEANNSPGYHYQQIAALYEHLAHRSLEHVVRSA